MRLARQVADPDLAMDLVAETFAQAYRARGRFRGSLDADAAAWLYDVFAGWCENRFARGFSLYDLYNRAAVFRPRLDAKGP